MASQGTKGLARLIKAVKFSCQGFKAAYANEEAFRQEIYFAIFFIPLGFYLGSTGLERALLISVVIIIPIIELINSSIETIVDRVSTEKHELSGRAKDLGSAAVFLAVVNSSIVWALVLIDF
jgi:diacylglycerol kinase (ATP)